MKYNPYNVYFRVLVMIIKNTYTLFAKMDFVY